TSTTLIVRGEQSGLLPGSYAVGGTFAIFDPYTGFKFGERVHVTLTTGITSTTGDPLNRNSSFSFVVGSTPGPETPNFFQSSPINELPLTTDVPRIFDVFDMDVDGDLDMVLASSGDNKLTWYENDGAQVFTEHIVYSLADFAFGVDAEDIDSDGDFDFVLASEADNQFAWFENDGSQNFTRIPISSGTSAFASLIYAADIDGDGDIDLVTGSRVAPSLSWHENNGSQVFTEHVIINSATDITSIVIRDIDGDLDLDIAAAYFFEDVLAWYENDGTQNFTEHVFATGLGNLNALDAGDINGDGTVDFIGVARGAPSVHAFVNDGFQNFSESQISTQLCEQVRVIDLDGDGDQDVILSGTELSWLENDGGGGFSSHTIENALTQMMVHAADMDLDGDLDVVASSWPPSKLAWYENTFAGPVCAVAPTADAGADQLICASDNAVLNGVLGGSASSAIWSTSGSGVFDDSSQITTSYTPSAADITSGTVQLTLTVAAAGPCPQVQDITVITIAGPITAGNPSVNVAVQQIMVVDVLSASTINNGDQISYTILQNPSKGTTTIGSDNSIRYLANSGTVGSDSFNYRICNQCGSCSDGTVNINIANVAPIFTPPPIPFEAAPGQSIVIPIPTIVTDLNGNIDLTSFSNFNSTANAAFSYNSANGDLTIDYTTASFTSAQDNISFRICDQLNSCTDVTVLITLNGQITVHNGISPNNDGLNDFFDIQNIQFIEPINKVTIYNRWGDKVYEQENYNSDDVSHRFDGKRNNGTELPSGIYFYKVEFPSGRSELTGYLILKK
ncbi:MAG TPA: FG-GAP-like repeat-containing protein, partial [Cyclobacteriaceae bacterium]|nr:FG-GAP-like repeat-containing protein [Cyclobacteriaceae bacterium]